MLGIVPCAGPYYDNTFILRPYPTLHKKHTHKHTHNVDAYKYSNHYHQILFSHTHDMHVRSSMKFKTHNGMETKKERKKDRVTFKEKERKANKLFKSTSSF